MQLTRYNNLAKPGEPSKGGGGERTAGQQGTGTGSQGNNKTNGVLPFRPQAKVQSPCF